MIFSPQYQESFKLFSPSHIFTMLLWVALWVAVPLVMKKKGNRKTKALFAKGFGTLLILQYLGWMVWEGVTGNFTLQESLPLNLCDFSNILCAILLFTRSERFFKVLYFWVLGGAIQSFITPNISYAFPHFEFFVFYIQHGGMILVILYMLFAEGMRPHFKNVFSSLGMLILYLCMVYGCNLLLDSNYNFLMADTPNPSVVTKMIAIFGAPPRHIIGLGGICIVTYTVLYVPFFLADVISSMRKKSN